MLLSKDLKGLCVRLVAKENVGLGLNIIFQQKQQWKSSGKQQGKEKHNAYINHFTKRQYQLFW